MAHTTAANTSADGTILDSSRAYYALAGGKAFPVTTPTLLAAVRKDDAATPQAETVTPAMTGAPKANGVLVTEADQSSGSGAFVSYNQNLYEFTAQQQFDAFGYGGTPTVLVPYNDGL